MTRTPAPRTLVHVILAAVLGLVTALTGPAPAFGAARPLDQVAATAGPGSTDPVGVWPLQPQPDVVTGFDPPATPWGSGHRGVDLLGSPGRQVRAALPGVVAFAGPLAGRGVVVVDHGTTRTTYEPVVATVSVGYGVAAGDPLGRLATAGSHCLPRTCLHWGWLRGEVYLDPLRLVGAGPVRLLPLWGATPVPGRPWAPAAHPYLGWRAPVVVRRAGAPGGTPGASGPW